MTIVSERPVEPQVSARLRAGLPEEIDRQEREGNRRGPEAEPFAARVGVAGMTVLEQVLREHRRSCVCGGGCGSEHAGGKCESEGTVKVPLITAPHPLPLTEHETASAPVSELRPWCGPCWRKARTRNAERAAELRRQRLDEAQTSLPGDLFGGGR
ncbi:hypothetical protein [Streptomyces fulvorobeus]|uniref:Uncharacterized protein n=1 Tax=Streptomyces fulvorobeus TaxID=284028 RepID=A0A7Y9HHY9_9ACTN|nr:hypothetical protein [Streptomyces fulvorobeus]NYE44841.1 hypothetical protein [Streptomyces fulvorobeus]